MSVRIPCATALVLCLMALTTGCGGDGSLPGGDERQDREHVIAEIRDGCPERIEAVVAVDFAGYGKTSGFLLVCEDDSVVAIDDDGGEGGDNERMAARALEDGLARCERGWRSVTALDHAGYGKTSGLLLLCDDGSVVAIGKKPR